jgi:hypothetical protein
MCNRCPKYPSPLPPLICILTASPFFFLASLLDCTIFRLFLTRFWERFKKVLFKLVSCCLHVSCLPKIPPDPSPPLTPLLPSLNFSNSVLLILFFFFFICFFRLCSCFLWVLLVLDPPLDVLAVRLAPLCRPYFAFFPNLFYFFWGSQRPGLDFFGLFRAVFGIVLTKVSCCSSLP